jgi:hypothetical protein
MLIFVVARTRLDRYEELRRHFEDRRDVWVVLDRREGERRARADSFTGVDRRSPIGRRVDVDGHAFMKLGWSVTDTEESDG